MAWETVGSIVECVVASCQSEARFEGLRNLGVDEFGSRKRHRYITVVIDHEQQRVIGAGKGKSAKTLAKFFNPLGESRCAQIEQVSIDMSAGYIKAITELLPQANIVFDRFSFTAPGQRCARSSAPRSGARRHGPRTRRSR
jgi:transposase